MPIRITGMNSGLDTDSIIQALMSAYQVKGDKYKKEQTKLSWTQDKWKALNTKVLNLYKSLDNLRFSSGYNLKKVTVSDTSKATVSGASNAMNGTQTLKINQVAKAAYLTGDKIAAQNGKTKLSDLISPEDGGASFEGGTIRVSGNGKAAEIEVTEDTTVNDFIKKLNESGTGISASFDSANKRIFISSKKTGADANFQLSALDEDGNKALTALGLNAELTISKDDKEAWDRYYGDESTIQANLTNAINEIINTKEALEDRKARKDEVLLDQKFYEDSVKYLKAKSALRQTERDLGVDQEEASAMSQLLKMSEKNQSKTYVMGDNGKLRVKKEDGSDDAKPTYSLKVDKSAQEDSKAGVRYTFTKTDPTDPAGPKDTKYFVPDESDEGSVAPGAKAIDALREYSKNENAVNKFEKEAESDADAGVYRKMNVVTEISDLEGGLNNFNNSLKENKEELNEINEEIAKYNKILADHAVLEPDGINIDPDDPQRDKEVESYAQKLMYRVQEFGKASWTEVKNNDGEVVGYTREGANKGAKMISGMDAEIELNGATYTSSTNSFNINGLSIQAQAVTNGEEISVTTATDTQGIYDKIKDFISEYNNLISEISSLYNAESARGYEPLTSDEKDAMSDKEIEEWEKKVKDSLLRRDDSLGSLMNSMTSAMLSSVKIGDKSYSLASLGIKTAGYFNSTAGDRNILHIDGDEDDDTTASKTNTLMNMLNSDPDKVIDILKGVTGNLYKSLNKKIMTSNSMKSINTIYNDKEMSQSYSDYTKTIRAWEEKMQKIEDNYYKKFSAMEVALSKLQSQQSSLAGLLGS